MQVKLELNVLLGLGLTLGAGIEVASPARIGVSTHVEAMDGAGPKLGAEVGNRRELRFKLGWGLVLRFKLTWDFPGGPVVGTPRFHCRGQRFNS